MPNKMISLSISFIEFVSYDVETLSTLFIRMGFSYVGKHPDKNMLLFKQGEIYFLIHVATTGHASAYLQIHGTSIASIGFAVADVGALAKKIATLACQKIAPNDATWENALGILGIGDSALYFFPEDQRVESAFLKEPVLPSSENAGLTKIDHIAMNVLPGESAQWSNFFAELLDFHEVNDFTIKGKHTSFQTRALGNEYSAIKLVISESSDPNSQIAEYITKHSGAGIQHLAFATQDIYASVACLRERDIVFMPILDTYYQAIDARLPGHREDILQLKKHRILIDGNDHDEFLLQIFTQCLVGPMFFEVIQRKGNEGFGAGNIKALFEAVEQDQLERRAFHVTQGEAHAEAI